MKVIRVIFLGYDENQGLTLHFADWIEALNKLALKSVELTVITLNKEQNPGLLQTLKKIPVTTIIIDRNKDLEKLDIFHKADIVHCHGIMQALMAQKIKKRKKLKFKIIITMHAFRHGSWYRPIYANVVSFLCLNKIDLVNFLSQSSKDEFLCWNFSYKKSNTSIVFPLGCKKERYASDISIEHLEFYEKLISNNKNIVYLADLIPRKRHMWLLKILKDLLIQEDARLWLFGWGDQMENIKKFIKNNYLNHYVYLPGRIDGKYIPSILKKMNIAICTSKSETMGHCIIEPMFAGLPVVTFDVGIASFAIRDYFTGFIIEDGSEDENFKRAIQFFFRNSNAAMEMGKNAKAFANKWLTWEVTAQNCINLYLSMFLYTRKVG